MLPNFFIDRPIFAWVIAIIICLGGILALRSLPVAQYPSVAPPGLTISLNYPGASAQIVEESAVALIEQEMNGIENLQYMESSSEVGSGSVTLTFTPGTDLNYASVEAQNRIKRVEARLPDDVRRLGVTVTKSARNFVMFFSIISPDGSLDSTDLGNYVGANLLEPLRRVPGVGEALLFGTEYSMRIWLHADKLFAYRISPADISRAVRAQNVQIPTGELGQLPAAPGQQLNAVIVLQGRLKSPEAFGDIIIRTNPDGSTLRLRDVARVELAAQTYARSARVDGHPDAGIAIRLTPGANALDTVKAAKAKMTELAKFFPKGKVDWLSPYDTSTFVAISIREVVFTLIEAIFLVFLVMYLFMGNFRATLIPTIVVPVALLGGILGLYTLNYSINVLTLFAMVLAIGIVVDDAIVVVENVERIMTTEHLSPKEATRKAMGQIIGAVIAITVVLIAVFLPMTFFGGSTGAIYRQFSVTLILTMTFSAFMAMTLTPALCASLLKPHPEGVMAGKGLLARFSQFFSRLTNRYLAGVVRVTSKTTRYLIIYVVIIAATIGLFNRLPASFLPEEDQGYFVSVIQLPPGATTERTIEVLSLVEKYFMQLPEVAHVVGVVGFSFAGSGQNSALAFVTLKDWDLRTKPGSAAQALVRKANMAFFNIKQGLVFTINPPPIPELAAAGGFDFRLQDRGGIGREKLTEARNMALGMASQNPKLASVRPEGQEPAPQLFLDIDRTKTEALGVSMSDLNDTLQSALGVAYINDFILKGRVLRVQMQADAETRKTVDSVLHLPVRNNKGEMLMLGELVTPRWVVAAPKLDRYNGIPSMKITGATAPGVSSGEALGVMEAIAAKLPTGTGFEWSGIAYEEKQAGSQAALLFAVSLIAVFLSLAALYESWSIPFAVMLAVPLGIFGSTLGVTLRGLPNDVYFKVGLIAIIGLSAKNAILIIEFARKLQDDGMSLIDATLEACRLRFRPILMTSIAFIAGVFPLAISTGAGAESRHAIGTGVIGGMLTATLLAVFFVPIFFMVIRKIFPSKPQLHQEQQDE